MVQPTIKQVRVSTDIGRIFLAMIDRHFPKGTQMGKLFNRSTNQLSKRTGRNLKRHLDSQNRAKLQKNQRKGRNVIAEEIVTFKADADNVESFIAQMWWIQKISK